MNIEDLKSDWQQAGNDPRSEKELAMMTRVRNHPVLRKLRAKFVFEIIALTALLFLYYDGFDGAKKPPLVNALLISGILTYLLNNAVSYYHIQNPEVIGNIRESLAGQTRALKRMAVMSIISAMIYAAALLLFFTYQTAFTDRKIITLSVLAVAMILMFYASWISWQRKIRHFQQLNADF